MISIMTSKQSVLFTEKLNTEREEVQRKNVIFYF